VQTTVNQSALDIQNGVHDVVIITGAECGNTQAKARRAGVELQWQTLPGAPDRVFGEDKDMRHPIEKALRIGQPIQIYPIFENALRHHRGESVAAHFERISELWAGFSRVAAGNPTPGSANRRARSRSARSPRRTDRYRSRIRSS
jgi:acetyl-CoA C-acetyltransferase